MKLEPLNQEHKNTGIVLYNIKNYLGALDCYEEEIELNPSNEGAWFNKGLCLFQLERYEEAIESYNKVIELNSSNEGALNNKGVCLLHLERDEEAMECFNKAIELNPSYEIALYNKKECLETLEMNEETLEYYDKLIELKPSDKENWKSKAELLVKQERYEEAIECYDKLIELEPDISYYFDRTKEIFFEVRRGSFFEKLDEYEIELEFKIEFLHGLVNYPYYDDEINYRIKDTIIEIREWYDEAIEICSWCEYYWEYKAECLEKLGDHEEAEKCLEKYEFFKKIYQTINNLINKVYYF